MRTPRPAVRFPFLRVLLLAALLGFVTNTASAFYSPLLGRFANRDPIGEAGGENIYAFVGNDPINFIDPLGLKWKIERTGGSTAPATAGDGDTIKSLAREIGLDAEDFKKWLTAATMPKSADDKVANGCKYEIPNTVFAHWGGDLGWLGKGLVSWDDRVAQFKSQHYNVVETKSTDGKNLYLQGLLETAASNRTLYGLLYQGHGNTEELASGGWAKFAGPDAAEVLFADIRNPAGRPYTFSNGAGMLGINLSYKMGLVILLACYSAEGKSALFSGAPGGTFEGYNGDMVPKINVSTGGSDKQGNPGRHAPSSPNGIPIFSKRF